ncbi:MAG: insulinase family protein [Armatimonadetes bacterium]|nr:insulinase family protein [Armatimonadota bacterium]
MSRRVFLVLMPILLGIVLAGPAGAETPNEGSIRAARATPVGRTVLPNGLVVLVTENPAEDIVALELLIRVGLADEKGPIAGITNIVQRILRDRISKNDKGKDRLESIGSLMKVSAEPDYARISLQTTSACFPEVLGYVAAALSDRTINPEETAEIQKEMARDFKDSSPAFPQLYEIFRQSFYRYHPYRNSDRGSELAVERLDPKAIEDFFSRYYAPNRMVLSIAGRVDRTTVLERIRKEFGPLSPGDDQVVEVPWEPKATEKQVHLSANSSIAWLFVGFPAPSVNDADYAAMTLLHALLGEGLSSRLFIEIREKKGLAYELGALYPPLRGPSHMLTYIITKPYDAGKAKNTLFEQIERLKNERVPVQELEESRRKVVGNYLLERETNRGKAFSVALAETIGVGYEYDLNFLQEIERVTPAEVQSVARRYLDNYTLVVARPGGRLYLDL